MVVPPNLEARKSLVWQSMCSENAFVVHPDRFGTNFEKKTEINRNENEDLMWRKNNVKIT
jgi:hypothetical protein